MRPRLIGAFVFSVMQILVTSSLAVASDIKGAEMRRMMPLLVVVSIAALIGLSSWSLRAANRTQQSGSTVPVTTVVTVLGPNFSSPAPIEKQDVNVYTAKNRSEVISWIPAKGDKAGLQLAILIDDADSPTALGTHFNEFKDFITSQPATTQVGLYYAVAGSAQAAAPFSTDHEAVAAKLRLPLGRFAGDSPSVYLSLQDLVSHWPANDMRHEVIVIASGVDYLDPGLDSPYVSNAVEKIQKSGTVVYTIYTGGPHMARASFHTDIAWQNLVQISTQSGGHDFFQGFETPVDFMPIFRQLNAGLQNQYLLTFAAPGSTNKKGEMQKIEVRTEQRNVKLSYSPEAFVPGP